MNGEKNQQTRLRLVVSNDRSSGYRSGRSSERETPDATSSAMTRFGGTRPLRSHFCTAWYRTPIFSAVDWSPPAASIALSTDVMSRNLQPIVALRQQPMRVSGSDTLQPMVVQAKRVIRTKDDVRKEFGARLTEHLERNGIPRRRQISYLYERLSVKGVPGVSKETCRKWTRGLELPDEANLDLLASRIGADPYVLRHGEHPIPSSHDDETHELFDLWKKIPDEQRSHVIQIMRNAAIASSTTTTGKRADSRARKN